MSSSLTLSPMPPRSHTSVSTAPSRKRARAATASTSVDASVPPTSTPDDHTSKRGKVAGGKAATNKRSKIQDFFQPGALTASLDSTDPATSLPPELDGAAPAPASASPAPTPTVTDSARPDGSDGVVPVLPVRAARGGAGKTTAAEKLRLKKLAALAADSAMDAAAATEAQRAAHAAMMRPSILLQLSCVRRDLDMLQSAPATTGGAPAVFLGGDNLLHASDPLAALAATPIPGAAPDLGDAGFMTSSSRIAARLHGASANHEDPQQRQKLVEKFQELKILWKKLNLLELCMHEHERTVEHVGGGGVDHGPVLASTWRAACPSSGAAAGGGVCPGTDPATVAGMSAIPMPTFCAPATTTATTNSGAGGHGGGRPKCHCFWDTCEFAGEPVYLPKVITRQSYQMYGCFCSPECALAYLMQENLDVSTRMERMSLLNHIYGKQYNYTKSIKPAPSPYYMLSKFMGNLTVDEFRALFEHDRVFQFLEKPVSYLLPAMYSDNNDFDARRAQMQVWPGAVTITAAGSAHGSGSAGREAAASKPGGHATSTRSAPSRPAAFAAMFGAAAARSAQ